MWVAYIDLLQPKVIFIFSIYSSTVKRLNVQNVLVNLASAITFKLLDYCIVPYV